jgi:hypothetical protein
MKYIQLKITEEQHKQIKLKAIEAEKSMHAYILDCIEFQNVTSSLKVVRPDSFIKELTPKEQHIK